ncbi:MAG: hypothetical protein ACMXYE_02440 [Candidatus Woesearchaeota archaeon]
MLYRSSNEEIIVMIQEIKHEKIIKSVLPNMMGSIARERKSFFS